MAFFCVPRLTGKYFATVEGRGSIVRLIELVVISISSISPAPGLYLLCSQCSRIAAPARKGRGEQRN